MKRNIKAPMAAAKEPTTPMVTGNWRFERPVFVSRLAPCSEACPLGQHIPAIMALNGEGDVEGAYLKILEENPFPGICGRVCFHPCERVCNRGRFDEAVSIKDLEWSVFKEAQSREPIATRLQLQKGRKVAVVGAGPAGLACAYFLALLGYQLTILEPAAEPEIVRLGIHDGSLEKADLEWETERILSLGVDMVHDVPDPGQGYGDLAEDFDALYASPTLNAAPYQKGSDPVTLQSGLVVLDERAIPSAGPVKKESQISRTVVRQIAAGKKAALRLDLHLRGAPSGQIRPFAVGRLGAVSYEVFKLGVTGRIPRPLQGVVRFEDLNLAHFEKTPRIYPTSPPGILDKQQRIASARRCFQCGSCTFCMRCYDYCPDLSIQMDGKTRTRAIDYDHCKGCGICAEECPRGAISWVHE
jgi:2-oxoacid:acceptor oxidoreductase delta subunit (pyruvate/2-ketoisovalerate family)